ncbi:unnamed protein product, partial [Didymodactylos carnosus]
MAPKPHGRSQRKYVFNRQCFLCGQSSGNAAAFGTISDAAHEQKFRSQIELIVPALSHRLSLIGENFHRSCYSTLIAKRRRVEIKRGKQAQSVTLDDQLYPSFLAQDDEYNFGSEHADLSSATASTRRFNRKQLYSQQSFTLPNTLKFVSSGHNEV